MQTSVYNLAQKFASSLTNDDLFIDVAFQHGESIEIPDIIIDKMGTLWDNVVKEANSYYNCSFPELKCRVDRFIFEGRQLLNEHSLKFFRKYLINYVRASYDEDASTRKGTYKVDRFENNPVPCEQARLNRAAEQEWDEVDYNSAISAVLLDDGTLKSRNTNRKLMISLVLIIAGAVDRFTAKNPWRVSDKSIVTKILMLVCNNVNTQLVFSACVDKSPEDILSIASAYDTMLEDKAKATSIYNSTIASIEQSIALASPARIGFYLQHNALSKIRERKVNSGGGDDENPLAYSLRHAAARVERYERQSTKRQREEDYRTYSIDIFHLRD